MPVVVAVLCAVAALVLLMVLLQSRGAHASTREALQQSERKAETLRTRADALDDDIKRLEADLAETEASMQGLREELTTTREDVDLLTTQRDQLTSDLEAAVEAREAIEVELGERDASLSVANDTIKKHEESVASSDELNLTLTHENEALQVQLLEAADEAAKRSAPAVPAVLVSDDGDDLDVPGFSPGMAWDLELVRSDRTWRYSVAANPVEDPSPFETTENALKLAIEIEALALREDVGAFIGIDWQAGTDIDPTVDPARAHLTLRLAQELLASAAREMSPSTLIVASDPARGGVSLEVVASDPDDVDFKIPPPPIASEWIGIDEHGGMVVTVRAPD